MKPKEKTEQIPQLLIEFDYDRYGEKYIVKDVDIEYVMNVLFQNEERLNQRFLEINAIINIKIANGNKK